MPIVSLDVVRHPDGDWLHDPIIALIPHPRVFPMGTGVVFFAALAAISGGDDRPSLVRLGGDPARGVLVNLTPGARPTDPPDAARPTVVFVHGMNPMPRAIHFTMAERLAEALRRRGGPAFTVLGWDWNAASFVSLHPRINEEGAVEQGRHLA